MMKSYIHIDDEFWDEMENGEMVILYHNGHEENIVVPEELDGHPITRISSIKPTEEAKSITIPKSVKVIEDDAFEGFPKDFVIYCYPTTEYSNKDGYKIVYLEDEVAEETTKESASEASIQEESPLSEQSAEDTSEKEVVITTVEESNTETSAEQVNSEMPASDGGNMFLSAVIFVIVLILLGISFLTKDKGAKDEDDSAVS